MRPQRFWRIWLAAAVAVVIVCATLGVIVGA